MCDSLKSWSEAIILENSTKSTTNKANAISIYNYRLSITSIWRHKNASAHICFEKPEFFGYKIEINFIFCLIRNILKIQKRKKFVHCLRNILRESIFNIFSKRASWIGDDLLAKRLKNYTRMKQLRKNVNKEERIAKYFFASFSVRCYRLFTVSNDFIHMNTRSPFLLSFFFIFAIANICVKLTPTICKSSHISSQIDRKNDSALKYGFGFRSLYFSALLLAAVHFQFDSTLVCARWIVQLVTTPGREAEELFPFYCRSFFFSLAVLSTFDSLKINY